MDTNVTQERREINDRIKKQVIRLEKENYLKKELKSDEMVRKIKKIVEDEVK